LPDSTKAISVRGEHRRQTGPGAMEQDFDVNLIGAHDARGLGDGKSLPDNAARGLRIAWA